MMHCGHTASVEWSLSTGYRHLPMIYICLYCDPLFTCQTGVPLSQILGLQIAAKPLQVEIWSLLATYKNLPTFYANRTAQLSIPIQTCALPKPKQRSRPSRVFLKMQVPKQYGRLYWRQLGFL